MKQPAPRPPRCIALYTSEYTSASGVGNAVLAFSNALAQRGYRVHVFTVAPRGFIQEAPQQPGITLHESTECGSIGWRLLPFVLKHCLRRPRSSRIMRFCLRTLLLFASFRRIYRTCAALQPDLIICEFLNVAALYGLACGILIGIPVLARTHGSDVDEVSTYGPLNRLSHALTLRHADYLSTTNQEFRQKMCTQIPGRPIAIIPNTLLPPQQLPERAAARNQLSFAPGSFHAICVGRLTAVAGIETKGIGYAIDAVAALPGIFLHVLGDGPLRGQYQQQAQQRAAADRIIFHGHIQHDELLQYLAATDALVFPSLTEGLSMTLLEALRAPCPIIATPVGGARDYLQDGSNALLVPGKDAVAITEALLRLRNDAALSARLRVQATATFNQYFTGEASVNALEHIVAFKGEHA